MTPSRIRSLLSIETRLPSAGGVPPGFDATPGDDRTGALQAEKNILDFVVSDESLDRFGEVITASGWRLDAYRRNPVFQNAHQYGDIVFTLGKALLTEVRGADPSAAHSRLRTPHLFQRIQFATEVNPLARIAYGLYRGRFLNAVSVGFIPLRWQDGSATGPGSASQTAAGGSPLRRRYLEQELLEVSAVAIPANPNALALGLRSGAVEKSDVRDTLDLLQSLCRAKTFPLPPPAAGRYQILLSLARELQRLLRRG